LELGKREEIDVNKVKGTFSTTQLLLLRVFGCCSDCKVGKLKYLKVSHSNINFSIKNVCERELSWQKKDYIRGNESTGFPRNSWGYVFNELQNYYFKL